MNTKFSMNTDVILDFFNQKKPNQTKECNDFKHTPDFPMKMSAVTEFQWMCNRSWLDSLSTSIAMVGILLGALTSGFLGDIIGRLRYEFQFCINCEICYLELFSYMPLDAASHRCQFHLRKTSSHTFCCVRYQYFLHTVDSLLHSHMLWKWSGHLLGMVTVMVIRHALHRPNILDHQSELKDRWLVFILIHFFHLA